MSAGLLLGTYTHQSASEGIYSLELDLQTGTLSALKLAIKQKNPSYFVLSADKRKLYTVEEAFADGMVYSYRLDSGIWCLTGSASSGGIGPCHVMLDEARHTLAVANYMDGAVSFYALGNDGALPAEKQTVCLTGHGADPARQEGPHAHQCVCFGDRILVCDLGTDKVRMFQQNAQRRYQEGELLLQTDAGDGPRHLVLTSDQNMLYLICELSNTLYVYGREGNEFVQKQKFAYLPPDTPDTLAGAIRLSPDENYLFVSSRGGYSGIAIFALEPETRMPSLCGLYPTAAFPRDLMPVGDYVVCACQQGNAVQSFRLDRKAQKLVLQHEVMLEQPVCIAVKETPNDC